MDIYIIFSWFYANIHSIVYAVFWYTACISVQLRKVGIQPMFWSQYGVQSPDSVRTPESGVRTHFPDTRGDVHWRIQYSWVLSGLKVTCIFRIRGELKFRALCSSASGIELSSTRILTSGRIKWYARVGWHTSVTQLGYGSSLIFETYIWSLLVMMFYYYILKILKIWI